jgi:hypothetical protein
MATIRDEELAQLAGDVLPERTVLSAVPMDGGSGASSHFKHSCSHNNQSVIGKQDGGWGSQNINHPQCGPSNHGDNHAGGVPVPAWVRSLIAG